MGKHTGNQLEWENPANWSGTRWIAMYFSKRDTRLLVPMRSPGWGWTINLGHRHGPPWLIGLVFVLPLLTLIICVLAAVLS